MDRRYFLSRGATLLGALSFIEPLLGTQPSAPASTPDFTLRIQPVTVELTPKHTIKTTGYNGTSPGPILKAREGETICVDVFNETNTEEVVHWHGLHIPSNVDGATEEGTPPIPPHGSARYTFSAKPSGTRWYHTHIAAGRNLNRGTYTGQFGFFYIQPQNEPGDYDAEYFLALKEWDPFWTTQMGNGDSLDVGYERFSINGRSLGFGDPLRVKSGQRILLRILNASATLTRRIAFSGHRFRVVALDGNPVRTPREVEILELGPAERVDAQVTMNAPGVWILGATDDHDREAGMGIVVEYAGCAGPPVWNAPTDTAWSYTAFGVGGSEMAGATPIPLVFRKKFVSSHWQDKWTINGKQFPHTDPVRIRDGQVYRLIFDNRSDEAHPLHLHRHTFELVKVGGVSTRGVRKDVVLVEPKSQVEVELLASNPGPTLFHCHNQMHMDFGFMTMFEYV
ncbi:MAG TPA: multicopper oxidase family protein [Bryobacteraceae bacterium]|jgi:FtsP/CotA-like multicopper oxidase with cupredoxin domain|nr:multicopper oxidase family protein [Bryobacteraceae bacterium]